MKILFFGEPLLRITPDHFNPLHNQSQCHIYFGGSEINVARALSGFGLDTKLITAVPHSPLGEHFIQFLQASQIDTSSIVKCGYRLGTYYLEEGVGARVSQVIYDRSLTSIRDINLEQINFDSLFQDVTHFHFSGITIAISESVRTILERLCQEAIKRHITISIDLNFRAKMISPSQAKMTFSHFAHFATYCFGIDPLLIDQDDMEMFDRDHATIYDIQQRMEKLKVIYDFEAIFHTQRYISHGLNTYQAYGLKNQFVQSDPLTTQILDRIGSGDAFVAGVLAQLLNEHSIQEALAFGTASATYKCTLPGDNMFVNREDVYSLYKGKNDVNR